MASGKKRASPGADEEKSPVKIVELSDEDAQKLQNVQGDISRAELILERRAQEKLSSIYAKRRAITINLPGFWSVALMNHPEIAGHIQHQADITALDYLYDVWVIRDTKEPRCFALEFYFKENPYFSDSVLKKEFKHKNSSSASDERADEDGITASMLNFSWETDVEQSAIKIQWKDASKNLTKLYPRKMDEGDDEDDVPADQGSFFNFFEKATDPYDIGLTIGNTIFPEAIDYFLGQHGGDELDSEEEEDDDDDAEEIDLEKPRPKRQKNA